MIMAGSYLLIIDTSFFVGIIFMLWLHLVMSLGLKHRGFGIFEIRREISSDLGMLLPATAPSHSSYNPHMLSRPTALDCLFILKVLSNRSLRESLFI